MSDFLIDDTDDVIPEKLDKKDGWKILIVDDEPSVHEVTHFALNDLVFENKCLDFISAYSGQEAKEILSGRDDIAVVLLDVVMETDTEGLAIAKWIREELGNDLIRIVLRTGQPGQAPERQVILDYDINDYKDKSELTAQKLFSCVITGIRSYRDLAALWNNRKGLKRVIKASTDLFKERYLREFTIGALQQLTALLYLETEAALMEMTSVAALSSGPEIKVIAASGEYEKHIGGSPKKIIPKHIIDDWMSDSHKDLVQILEKEIVVSFSAENNRKSLLYFTSSLPLSTDSQDLINLFTRNISIAHENLRLSTEAESSQSEIISLLSGAVETRSKETANHIVRVSQVSALIADKLGLSSEEVETIRLASPLHDIGKVGIPDNILNKPGKLTEDEWAIMATHAELGEHILKDSNRPVVKSGAIIAAQHHEKWDGSGYPQKLRGEEIHIFGRITALADVFDALCSKRCYKKAWTVEQAIELIERESGKHFDPNLVRILLENLDAVIEIQSTYSDTDTV